MKHAEQKKAYYNDPENMVVWFLEDGEWVDTKYEPCWHDSRKYTVRPKGEDPNKAEKPEIIEVEIDWSGEGTIDIDGKDFDIELKYRYPINGTSYRCIGFRFGDICKDDRCIIMKFENSEVIGSEKATHAIMEKVN
jgi:hypothetical protein